MKGVRSIENVRRFARELSSRHVLRVVVAYLAVAFVLVQVADLAAGAFGLPTWFEPLVWVLAALGLPVVIVLAWAFEMTPEGIRRTPPAGPFEEWFMIDEDVCRTLDQDDLDPSMVGDHLTYLDNRVRSDVLVCYLHGFGADGGDYREHLRAAQYRAVAPTLYGFEPGRTERIALSYDDHVALLRSFLNRAIATIRPRLTVLVGMSSGADAALRLAAEGGVGAPAIDGILALGPNLSYDTTFGTRVFGKMGSPAPEALPRALSELGASASTLEEWLISHEYLVRTIRKFRTDLAPMVRFAQGIFPPFEAEGVDAFIRSFRAANERVGALLCVVSDSRMEMGPLETVKMRNLREGVLGPAYRPGSLRVERNANHFELDQRERVDRHLADLLAMLDAGAPLAPVSAEVPAIR